MLRIDLLRHLPQATEKGSAPPPPGGTGSTWKPVVFVLLVLLLAGGGIVTWKLQEHWIRFFRPAEPVSASLDTARAKLEREASGLVLRQQSVSIEWLYELEALTASGARLTRVIFQPPGDFQLRGTVPTDADLSRIQESLVLLPNMNLRLSRSSVTEDGHAFLFLGDLQFPDADMPPADDRIVGEGKLSEEMEAFSAMATAAGIRIASSEPATTTPSSHLHVHTWRLSVSCEITVLREFLNTARYRNSPFGIQRVTLDASDTGASPQVTLDILAFSR